MNRQLLVGAALVAALTWIGGSAQGGAAPEGRPHVLVCGPYGGPHELVEPPNVDVWKLPLNASSEHELILTVHKDGHGDDERYCYRYALNGTIETVAPTIRVRRGEHFALRIVNDIKSPSEGEKVASTAIPPCMPMAMPAPTTNHYVGYLNHTIDDRFMHVAAVDTNIHLHGFQGPASEEDIFLSTLSTPMHACEYHLTIPRTQPVGTYMYHPHAHGASDIEVALGLDGVWIVEPDQPQLPRSDEHVIMLRYRVPYKPENPFAPDESAFIPAAMAHEVGLKGASPAPYDPFDPPPWPVTYPMTAGGLTLDPTGCNGAASEPDIAINGADSPVALHVAAGTPQLLRIVNGTSDSASALEIRDASGRKQSFALVALDGRRDIR